MKQNAMHIGKWLGIGRILLLAGAMAAGAISTRAATDYFVVSYYSTKMNYIFAYDTVAKTVTERAQVAYGLSTTTPNEGFVSAGAGGAFWVGEPAGGGYIAGFERFKPAGALGSAWSSDLRVDMGYTTAKTYYDSSVRGVVSTRGLGNGAAELSDGTLFACGNYNAWSSKYGDYAVGNVLGLSGTISNVFTADSQHMGTLANDVGSNTRQDVASTIAGTSKRFIVCSYTTDKTIMVYNSDGTYKDVLTKLTDQTAYRAVGTMKSAGMGDVVLQLVGERNLPASIYVDGRSVAEADFNTVKITKFGPLAAPTGANWLQPLDVDGTQSGLIMVFAQIRLTAGGDGFAVRFFNTDGTAHSACINLNAIEPALPTGYYKLSCAGLYALAPQVGDLTAKNLTTSSVDLIGNLTTGDAPVLVTCYWGTSPGGTDPSAWGATNTLPAMSTLGYVTNHVGSLSAGTYNFRYFASNFVGTCWSTNSTFTIVAGMPVIANVGPANIQATAADMVGNLTEGGTPVTATCYWGTNDGATTASAWMTNNSQSVSATGYVTNSILSGLTSGTRYYFRFYATNGADQAWAPDTLSFSTLGAPTVDNDGGVANKTINSAQLRGTVLGGNPDPDVWIYWGTTNGETDVGSWNRGGIPLGPLGLGVFSFATNGLTANQTYWYRCYVTNIYGGNWAAASTNFTMLSPGLSIGNTSVVEGALGTTTQAVLTVTLSVTSAVAVSVSYVASNGTATAEDNDYVATANTLVIPAGNLTGTIPVTVNGDNVYESAEVFYVWITNAVGATPPAGAGTVTIVNDDYTFYVRGDGSGSDTYSGGTWGRAFATLQKALDTVPVSSGTRPWNSPAANVINVQASTGGQAYAVCLRTMETYGKVDVRFEGGWTNVDLAPVQGGMSVVSGTVTTVGILFPSAGAWKRVGVNRFAFTNVLRGIELSEINAGGPSDTVLLLSNSTIRAQADGVYIEYPRPRLQPGDPHGGYCDGGLAQITAGNVDIVAGLGGTGGQTNHGIYINGAWMGSSITASGTDPATGAPRVSTITSSNGCGVYFTGPSNEVQNAWFANTAIYGCSTNGIHLDAQQWMLDPGTSSDQVQASLSHCTIAENGEDGVQMAGVTLASYGSATNCIFANNAGHGLNLGAAGGSFTCAEDHNVFYNDDILVNGAVQAPAPTTSSANPLFKSQDAKPSPWYTLGSRASPAYNTASDGSSRGAYQNTLPPIGTLMLLL